jgi:hypothetical protein
MPYSVCLHFYGDPANYFTHPPEVNALPGIKHCYEALPWSWKECIQRVTVKGLYLSNINGSADSISCYQEYMEELSSSHPSYTRYARVLQDRNDEDWMLPVGRIVVLNHRGVLQVCLLQCPAFREGDDKHLAYRRGRSMHRYACPQRPQLVEALADALFEYAYWCHTYAEMEPVKGTMESALRQLEYALFVFLTLRKREIPLSNPRLREVHRPTLLKAYKQIRTIVKGVDERDYTKMTPADVRNFVEASFLDLLTHEEAIDIGFATPEESWPRTHGGRMQRGSHLEWLENISEAVYGSKGARQRRWRQQLENKLIRRLSHVFENYGPPKYPKQATRTAIAEILAMCGLNRGSHEAVAEQVRHRL